MHVLQIVSFVLLALVMWLGIVAEKTDGIKSWAAYTVGTLLFIVVVGIAIYAAKVMYIG